MPTAHVPDLAAALERHVQVPAGDIGERNVFRPGALHAAAAAAYIAQQWTERGCEVTPQDYQMRGVPCANLEVALVGCVQADDNVSGVAPLLEIASML
jgi:hypothetical protein